MNSTSLLARYSIRECACTMDKTVYWGLCIMETSMASRDGGDIKSSKSRGVGGWVRWVCPWRQRRPPCQKNILKFTRKSTGLQRQGKGISPQELSHPPRAGTNSVFFVGQSIYSALWSISTLNPKS